MQVNLDPQLSALIRREVEAGLYPDPDAVVREAPHLLKERDWRHALRAALTVGFGVTARG